MSMVCLQRSKDEIKHRMIIGSVYLYLDIFDTVAKSFDIQITKTNVKVAP